MRWTRSAALRAVAAGAVATTSKAAAVAQLTISPAATWLAQSQLLDEHAKRFVPTTRTWSNSTFLAGLDDEARRPEEKDAIVDVLFDQYTSRVAENPEAHAMDYVHSYLELTRIF